MNAVNCTKSIEHGAFSCVVSRFVYSEIWYIVTNTIELSSRNTFFYVKFSRYSIFLHPYLLFGFSDWNKFNASMETLRCWYLAKVWEKTIQPREAGATIFVEIHSVVEKARKNPVVSARARPSTTQKTPNLNDIRIVCVK